MDIKAVIETYLDIVKNKYVCFEGTATQQEFIYYLAVWVVCAFALGIVSVILRIVGLGVVGAILSAVWNLANLLPGIGTLIRFLNSKKVK